MPPLQAVIAVEICPASPLAALTTRLEYIPTTSQPLYLGQAPMGASDTDPNSRQWTIVKYTYDTGTNLVSQKAAQAVAWANRATVTYA